MLAAIPFPDIGPELFSFTVGGVELALRWYALAYIAGLLVGRGIVAALVRRPELWPGGTAPMTRETVDTLFTAVILGVILGGRLGYVLFYQPGHFLANPGDILKVWQGGMSFHGGMLGVVAAILIVAWRHAVPVSRIADALAVATPAGLFFGRLANFVNAELWGRPTDMPWGVVFPGDGQYCGPAWPDPCARHPSQLYEAGLEGLLLGAVLLILAHRGGLTRPFLATGVFLAGYGLARMFVEIFRQADAQYITPDNPLGRVALGLSMGQLLSLPMVLAGASLIAVALSRR